MNLWDAEAIDDAGALTSPWIDLKFVSVLEALVLKVTSVLGAASVQAQYQSSPDGTAANADAVADNVDIVAATLAAKAGNPEGFNSFDFPTFSNRFVRIVITDLASTTDSLVSAKLLLREEGRL
jgi:hypothetical protein